MSRSGEVTLEFAGEQRTFRLAIGQWRKVQEKCDAGPAELLARLAPPFAAAKQGLNIDQIVALGYLGAWRVDDVREVVLQGLLGANVAGPDALRLVRDWIEERPLLEGVATAYTIVLASIVGTEDEEAVGEPQATAEASQHSPVASSDMARADSTPSAAPSDGPPASSTT